MHSLEKKLAEEELKVSAAKLQLEQVEPKWEDRCSKLHQQMKAMEKEMAMTQLKLSEAEGRCIALSQESKEWVGQINIMDANHASDLEKAMAEIATYKQEILRRDKMIAQLQKQIKELERTIRNISTETGEEISEATVRCFHHTVRLLWRASSNHRTLRDIPGLLRALGGAPPS